jgi:2-(1,2-epoxy-1,2-dihydrophenyl)acetyl-CoA isomerase
MINEIVPEAELRTRATALATELANGPTFAYGTMRHLLRESWANTLSAQLAAETRGIQRTGDSRDAASAIAAFAAKQTPHYVGR